MPHPWMLWITNVLSSMLWITNVLSLNVKNHTNDLYLQLSQMPCTCRLWKPNFMNHKIPTPQSVFNHKCLILNCFESQMYYPQVFWITNALTLNVLNHKCLMLQCFESQMLYLSSNVLNHKCIILECFGSQMHYPQVFWITNSLSSNILSHKCIILKCFESQVHYPQVLNANTLSSTGLNHSAISSNDNFFLVFTVITA